MLQCWMIDRGVAYVITYLAPQLVTFSNEDIGIALAGHYLYFILYPPLYYWFTCELTTSWQISPHKSHAIKRHATEARYKWPQRCGLRKVCSVTYFVLNGHHCCSWLPRQPFWICCCAAGKLSPVLFNKAHFLIQSRPTTLRSTDFGSSVNGFVRVKHLHPWANHTWTSIFLPNSCFITFLVCTPAMRCVAEQCGCRGYGLQFPPVRFV